MEYKRLKTGGHKCHQLARGRIRMEVWDRKSGIVFLDVRFEKSIRCLDGDMK